MRSALIVAALVVPAIYATPGRALTDSPPALSGHIHQAHATGANGPQPIIVTQRGDLQARTSRHRQNRLAGPRFTRFPVDQHLEAVSHR